MRCKYIELGGWGKAAEQEEMTAAANAVKAEIEKQANDDGKPITSIM